MTPIARSALSHSNLLKPVYLPIFKKFLFDQFCCTLDDLPGVVRTLKSQNVRSIVDYAEEQPFKSKGVTVLDKPKIRLRSVIATLSAIDAASVEKGNFVAIKVSSFVDPEWLEALNTLVENSALDSSIRSKIRPLMSTLSEMCVYAQKKGVKVTIDAEQSEIDKAIKFISRPLLIKFNQLRCNVWITVQAYLKATGQTVQEFIKYSQDRKYILGVKLVRGAYLEHETESAKSSGKPNPIWATKYQTDNCYDETAKTLVNSGARVLIASHNRKSIETAFGMITNRKTAHKIGFAQLLGMGDSITAALAKTHANVFKYVPFGKPENVMPYLMRRAVENSALNLMTRNDIEMLNEELRKRKFMRRGFSFFFK